MQSVTISMDEALLRLTEAEARNAGKSVSDFILEVLAEEIAAVSRSGGGHNPQLEALERVFAGPLLPLSENGRMPSAEERNARR